MEKYHRIEWIADFVVHLKCEGMRNTVREYGRTDYFHSPTLSCMVQIDTRTTVVLASTPHIQRSEVKPLDLGIVGPI